MSRDAVGTMSSVPRPRGDVCKWVRLILHVGPFACQILSLIIRGQCLHKADAVPKDVFHRLCETEKQRPRRCGVPLKSNPLQILQRIYSALEVGLAAACGKNLAVKVRSNEMNTRLYLYLCEVLLKKCIPQTCMVACKCLGAPGQTFSFQVLLNSIPLLLCTAPKPFARCRRRCRAKNWKYESSHAGKECGFFFFLTC